MQSEDEDKYNQRVVGDSGLGCVHQHSLCPFKSVVGKNVHGFAP